MIKDYHILKQHCNIEYRINNKISKIGDLSDTQLETAEKILSKWDDLKPYQIEQLQSVKYVKNYRFEAAKTKLNKSVSIKKLEKANRIADEVTLLVQKLISNNIKK